jgi:ribonuclease-3
MTKTDEIKKGFNDPALFEQALSHRSWLNESDTADSNERMEFLGDAVLELAISDALYHELPDKPEGFLTALRANIVNTKNLAYVAAKLDIGSSLKLSKGEDAGGGRTNSSLLADTVEAIIGAIYLDRGYAQANNFIKTYLLSDLDQKLKEPLKDSKSLLQEKVQALGAIAPKYKVVKEVGPDHDKIFTVEVHYTDSKTTGSGKSKSEAEQDAAASALAALEPK